MANVHIRTYGCSLNQSDSEVMAGLLSEAGFTIVKSAKDADVIVVNTCAVKAPTESKFFRYLSEIEDLKKYVIITGCIPQTMPDKLSGYTLLGTSQLNHIVEAVEETLHDNQIIMLAPENNERLNLPKVRKNPAIEIIPINSGCLGECSYCIVKRARGDLISYQPDKIVRQAQKAAIQGVSQIWLTSQDTGCYGKDIGFSLPKLLMRLSKIPEDLKIRLGMLNPNHAVEMLDDLVECYRSDKLFKFIHVPVQSGNDEILKKMNRYYTSKQFIDLVRRIRERFSDMTIATDIICGFPGETDAQFADTLELIRSTQPDIVNISRYWERPHTRSAQMEDKIHPNETKERSRKAHSLFEYISFERNKRWIGWQGDIIIDSHTKPDTSVGHNHSYKQVIVQGMYPFGTLMRVKVIRRTSHYLIADILEVKRKKIIPYR